jgi:hypothetical protein
VQIPLVGTLSVRGSLSFFWDETKLDLVTIPMEPQRARPSNRYNVPARRALLLR